MPSPADTGPVAPSGASAHPDHPAGSAGTGFNLGLLFQVAAEASPDRELLVWRDRRLTYGQMAERARRLAAYLHRLGLGAHAERDQLAGHESGQDHVALALYNANEYLEGMLGGYLARVAPFNVNYRYVGEELTYLLNDARARAIVYHASLAPVIESVRHQVPTLEHFVQVADDSGEPLLEGAVDYDEALASVDPVAPPVVPSPDDLYILYTGGTTGMPKGVLWRQHDIFMAAMGGRRMGTGEEATSYEDIRQRMADSRGSTMLILPPLMHGAAQWSTFYLMLEGSTFVLPDNPRRLDPPDVWRTIVREGVNGFTVVGDAMMRPLLDELEAGSYQVDTLVLVGNGGAALTPTVRARMRQHFPNLIISDTAGSSEAGAQMTAVTTDVSAPVRFKPSPGAAVVNETFDAVLEPGHEGIGWLAQGGAMPLGYLGDPEKTARTFRVVDGVRYSIPGDRARYEPDGQIELLGRDSVTINSGGEKIFVEEVEGAIAGHPAVADVVVTSRPSERWGQEVVAVVALVPGATASAEDLCQHASSHIARYKLPKKVVFVDAVQRSPSGKADYRWAKEQASAS